MAETETVPITPQEAPAAFGVQLAFCTACGLGYLYTDGVQRDAEGEPAGENEPADIGARARPHSPCCGREPVLTYDLETLFEVVNSLAELAQGSPSLLSPGQPAAEPSSAAKPSRQGRRGRQTPAGSADEGDAAASGDPPKDQGDPDSPPPTTACSGDGDDDEGSPGGPSAGTENGEPSQ